MKRTSVKLILLVMLSACSLGMSAQTDEVVEREILPGSVTVSGRAVVELEPDTVTFTVGVQTLAATVGEAVRENGEKTRAVLSALRDAGAEDEELQTRNFSVYPQMRYHEGETPTITSYSVSNEIVVYKDDPAAASRLLEAAITAGANTGGGLSFVVSDPSEGDETGLVAAYLDARSRAELLAQAAGRTLGRTISITEGAGASPPMPGPVPYARSMAMESAVNVPVETGRERKVYQVTVIFSLD